MELGSSWHSQKEIHPAVIYIYFFYYAYVCAVVTELAMTGIRFDVIRLWPTFHDVLEELSRLFCLLAVIDGKTVYVI